MSIDSHQHFWSLARGDYGWLTPDLTSLYRDFAPNDLAAHLRASSVTRTVVVQAAPTLAETRYLLDLAQRTPFIAGVVGWIDMLAADAPETIASLAQNAKLRGIRPMLQDIPDTEWIARKELTPALHALQAHGLRFDALVRPAHLAALSTMIERHPDLPVVIDHGAKPRIAESGLDEWEMPMRHIARETGAFCKVSGLLTEAASGATLETLRPYLDVLFECFGPERLMWGSDWPVLNLASDYESWWQMTLQYLTRFDASVSAAVLGGTAAQFYDVSEEI